MSTATQLSICLHCRRAIRFKDGVGWVHQVSGVKVCHFEATPVPEDARG